MGSRVVKNTILYDEVRDVIDQKINEAFALCQEKYKIRFGDIFPEDAITLSAYIDEMAALARRVLMYEKYDCPFEEVAETGEVILYDENNF